MELFSIRIQRTFQLVSTRLRGSFLAVTPKKNQKNASRTIGCDIVKYAKTWLFRINTYLRAKGDRNECIFYF